MSWDALSAQLSSTITPLPSAAMRSSASGTDQECARGPDSIRSSTESGACTRTSVSRSEEHTSELQSLTNLVCRLLLEKKKKKNKKTLRTNVAVEWAMEAGS